MTNLCGRCLLFPSSFLISFSHSASQLCHFPTLQILPQSLLLSSGFVTSFSLTPSPLNSAYVFFRPESKILFCLNCSIFCLYLLILALFASILCFGSSISASLYPLQSYVSILIHCSSYPLLFLILSVLPPTHLQL